MILLAFIVMVIVVAFALGCERDNLTKLQSTQHNFGCIHEFEFTPSTDGEIESFNVYYESDLSANFILLTDIYFVGGNTYELYIAQYNECEDFEISGLEIELAPHNYKSKTYTWGDVNE